MSLCYLSAITIALVAGAEKSLPILSNPTISPPPERVRWTIASIFYWVDQPILMRSGTGMPATVEYSTTGTIVSPWPPSTKAVTSSTETSNSSERKWRKRHETSPPALRHHVSGGRPETTLHAH